MPAKAALCFTDVARDDWNGFFSLVPSIKAFLALASPGGRRVLRPRPSLLTQAIPSWPPRHYFAPTFVSTEIGFRAAQLFHVAALRLRLAQAFFGGARGLRLDAPLGHDARLPDQLEQALACIIAVALLRAEALRLDDEHALVGEPPAGEAFKAHTHFARQRRRRPHVETQLHRRRNLVDVLPTRSR